MSVQGKAQVAARRTAVYRLYDASGELLYVGVSHHPRARLKAHGLRKPWWPEVSRDDVQWHPDRDAALREEARVIREENPRYNAFIPLADGSVRGGRPRYGSPEGTREPPTGRGKHSRFVLDDDLWERLGEAVKRADPDDNRSALIRRLVRWYVGDIEEMPKRPEPKRPER